MFSLGDYQNSNYGGVCKEGWLFRSQLSLGSLCTGITAGTVQPNQQPGHNTLHVSPSAWWQRRCCPSGGWLSGSFRQLHHTHCSSTDQTAALKGAITAGQRGFLFKNDVFTACNTGWQPDWANDKQWWCCDTYLTTPIKLSKL